MRHLVGLLRLRRGDANAVRGLRRHQDVAETLVDRPDPVLSGPVEIEAANTVAQENLPANAILAGFVPFGRRKGLTLRIG